MTDKKRRYRMTRRAAMEQQTRRRITEALVALHERVGPAHTSISLLARHAGVRRSTVYRHFPDETALLTACSTHWRAAHPPPSIERWAAIAEPDLRLETALRELYGYYEDNERMLTNLLRDEAAMPTLRRLLDGFRGYLAHAQDILARALNGDSAAERRRVRAAVGHALAFFTWRSLVRDQGLDGTQAADLMCRLAAAARAERASAIPSPRPALRRTPRSSPPPRPT
jgi:AcrR family transcriptional regulator